MVTLNFSELGSYLRKSYEKLLLITLSAQKRICLKLKLGVRDKGINLRYQHQRKTVKIKLASLTLLHVIAKKIFAFKLMRCPLRFWQPS